MSIVTLFTARRGAVLAAAAGLALVAGPGLVGAASADEPGGIVGSAPLWGTLDAMVRTPGAAWAGAEVVGPRQQVPIEVAPRGRGTAYVRVCNQNEPQQIGLRATAGDRAFAVRYLVAGRDVTKAVVAGNYRTPRLEAGACAERVRVVLVRKRADVGTERVVAVTATPATGTGDRVSVRVRAN